MHDDDVIVVIEGTSAAGKTTWCEEHARDVLVPEVERAGPERWQHALELERTHGIAVCDSDPAKLYYDYALWMTGRLDDLSWEKERDATRAAFAADELGLADVIFFAALDVRTLVRHRDSDPGRRRHRFWLHVELQPWFERWWRAVESVEPGRVFWRFPTSLDEARAHGVRERRIGGELLDAVLAQLA